MGTGELAQMLSSAWDFLGVQMVIFGVPVLYIVMFVMIVGLVIRFIKGRK